MKKITITGSTLLDIWKKSSWLSWYYAINKIAPFIKAQQPRSRMYSVENVLATVQLMLQKMKPEILSELGW